MTSGISQVDGLAERLGDESLGMFFFFFKSNALSTIN